LVSLSLKVFSRPDITTPMKAFITIEKIVTPII
jgi:hypothetical protein